MPINPLTGQEEENPVMQSLMGSAPAAEPTATPAPDPYSDVLTSLMNKRNEIVDDKSDLADSSGDLSARALLGIAPIVLGAAFYGLKGAAAGATAGLQGNVAYQTLDDADSKEKLALHKERLAGVDAEIKDVRTQRATDARFEQQDRLAQQRSEDSDRRMQAGFKAGMDRLERGKELQRENNSFNNEQKAGIESERLTPAGTEYVGNQRPSKEAATRATKLLDGSTRIVSSLKALEELAKEGHGLITGDAVNKAAIHVAEIVTAQRDVAGTGANLTLNEMPQVYAVLPPDVLKDPNLSVAQIAQRIRDTAQGRLNINNFDMYANLVQDKALKRLGRFGYRSLAAPADFYEKNKSELAPYMSRYYGQTPAAGAEDDVPQWMVEEEKAKLRGGK